MAVLLVLAFLGMPLLEIYVIIQVGQQIGALPTVVLLLLESAFGAWIVRREGRRAWRALRAAFGTGRLPGGELADAALVLVGGTLLLTPGFVTDALGFLMILPLTRPLARRALAVLVARGASRVTVRRFGVGPDGLLREAGGGGGGGGPRRRSGGHVPTGKVVEGEVVGDDEADESPGRAAGG